MRQFCSRQNGFADSHFTRSLKPTPNVGRPTHAFRRHVAMRSRRCWTFSGLGYAVAGGSGWSDPSPSVGRPAVTQRGVLRAIFRGRARGRRCSLRRLTCQRCVVGLVTGGGSQLPLPWSKGTPCCWADAGAGAAPARTAAIVSMIDSLATTNSFAASALKGNAARRNEVPRPRSSAAQISNGPANQAPSNQPVGGARTRPTTTRVNVIASSSRRRCRVVGRRASPGTPGTA